MVQPLKNLLAMQGTPVQFLRQEDSLETGQAGVGTPYSKASLLAQLVKNPPAMQEIWV